jgi:Flp pilus assembly protein TadB
MKVEVLFKRIRRLFPKFYLKLFEKNAQLAGIEMPFEKFFTLVFFYSFFFAFLAFSILLFYLKTVQIALLISFFIFLGTQISVLIVLNLIADKRAKFAEEVLPDVLQLMAGNIRSGLTPDKALLFSARPEFGILEKEIKLAGSKTLAGKPIEEALLEMAKRIKSRIVERTFNLIAEGMRKGGEIASLLEETANDIRDWKTMKKEISAQVGMYTIFIFIAVGIATPLLFAFSSHLVETMVKVTFSLKIEEQARQFIGIEGFRIGQISLDPEFIKTYALVATSISSLFGSLIIGLLQEGKEKAGIKYIPILLILNYLIFFTARIFLAQIVSIITPQMILP